MSKIFNHDLTEGKDEWLTPPEILRALDTPGQFDLDPCAPIRRPWAMAKNHYTIQEDGLRQKWGGRIWCNPPYGRQTGLWLSRLSRHRNGIALVFARIETQTWFNYVWGKDESDKASAILFIEGRLIFYNVDGTPATGKDGKPSSAGAPSALIAYGEENAEILKHSGIKGAFVPLGDMILVPTQRWQQVEMF